MLKQVSISSDPKLVIDLVITNIKKERAQMIKIKEVNGLNNTIPAALLKATNELCPGYVKESKICPHTKN